MSIAHKCDRCEALYEDAIGNVSFNTYDIVIRVEDENGAVSQGWSADLCPPCSKLFLEFVKHDDTIEPTTGELVRA